MRDNIIPPDLIKSFKDNNVVLFIGSGFSNNAKYPTWDDLLTILKGEFGDKSSDEIQYFESMDNIKAVQYLYDKYKKNRIISEIEKIFNRVHIDPELHLELMSIPFQYMITTNWDSLLEKYYEKFNKREIKTIWKDSQLSSLSSQKAIIKLHGSIVDPDSVVFGEDEYYKHSTTNPLIFDFISNITATKTILFIGYSYSDFDFKSVFNYVKNKLGDLMQTSFIFLPNSTKYEASYLDKRGLTPIIFNSDSFKSATRNFLINLKKQISITATCPEDRLSILNRENNNFLIKSDNLMLRNTSNLGPLGTPLKSNYDKLFGNREITDLESSCAESWMKLIQKGAQAKCIVCLEEIWISLKKNKDGIKERLTTFKENYKKYKNQVEIVMNGIPVNNNLNIYNNELLLDSKRIWFDTDAYERLTVYRNLEEVEEAINDFESTFKAIKKNNLHEADLYQLPGDDKQKMERLLMIKIEKLLNI